MRLDSDPSNSNGLRHRLNGSSHSTVRKNGFPSPTGGHSPAANGISSSHGNGFPLSNRQNKTTDFFGHDREEVTRLLIQGLGDLGYPRSADALTQESGYEVESPSVAAFRHAVLQGEWAEAESLLFGSMPTEDVEDGSIANGNAYHPGLKFADGADFEEMKFRMREQKYLEMLERRDVGGAIMVLRHELTPLHQDVAKLHYLSRYAFPDFEMHKCYNHPTFQLGS